MDAGKCANPACLVWLRNNRSLNTKAKGLVIGLVIAALVLLLAGSGVMAQDTKQNPTKNTDPPEAKPDTPKVKKAVDQGVEFLRQQLLKGEKQYYYPDPQPGSDVGVSALAGLTLLECGVRLTDPAVKKVYEYVHDTEKRLRFTYWLTLAVLFLDRMHQGRKEQLERLKKSGKDKETLRELEELQAQDAKDINAIHRISVRILAAQNKNGGWDNSVRHNYCYRPM